MFGDRNSTQADFENAERMLGFILLCNTDETVTNLTYATMMELGMRQTYFVMNVWPFQKENKEVRYLQWPNGKHWYAKIGNDDVVDAQGNQKWSTKKEAEKAAEWFLKQ